MVAIKDISPIIRAAVEFYLNENCKVIGMRA